MSTSADTAPIAPARFAAALKALSVGMLHLKNLEIRNSIAHLQYSNDQLRPFAAAAEPDQDCVDAIRENEAVIERMAERIALLRAEVEDRGVGWTEFQSADEVVAKEVEVGVEVEPTTTTTNGARHAAWSDGTFQTGVVSVGEMRVDRETGRDEGGRLTDEELSRAMQERLRDLEDDDEEGMHL